MAQSKYILATYSRRPGRVNKHQFMLYWQLIVKKSDRVNKRRFIKNIINLIKGEKTWQIKAYENL